MQIFAAQITKHINSNKKVNNQVFTCETQKFSQND